MQSILDFLNGRKTYVVAILFAIFNVGATVGWWTPDDKTWQALDTILGALGLAFLRAGVTKSNPEATK